MDRGLMSSGRWKWCSLIASVAFLAAVRSVRGQTWLDSERQRSLVLVSTLDGHVTALDMATGNEAWSVNTGARPMLSSSITNLEINRDGHAIRLIPSLDGSLYQYDGSGIEPVPLAADVLLSNSFRFGHDSTVVGGKEVESYGINVITGQLKYICSAGGCQHFMTNASDGGQDSEGGDTLVITRHTKTVRAVEMQTGNERWNFSVSQHEVTLVKSDEGEQNAFRMNHDSHPPSGRGDEAYYSNVRNGEPIHGERPSYTMNDLHFKVIVPSGLVMAVLKTNVEQILWQQQFGAAVANAWLLYGDSLLELNLFDNENVPALSTGLSDVSVNCDDYEEPDEEEGSQCADGTDAILYVGVYNNQLYVQPSYSLQQQVRDAASRALTVGHSDLMSMPRVPRKPYIATAVTPFLSQPMRKQTRSDVIGQRSRALIPHPIHHPLDQEGDTDMIDLEDRLSERLTDDRQTTDEVSVSNQHILQFFTLWKELLALSVLTVCVSVMVHLLLVKTNPDEEVTDQTSQSQDNQSTKTGSSADSSQSASNSADNQTNYVSRYYSDFEQVAVLGHGGFGVVFEAKNKLDDCQYAIKRIALNKNDRAKERVMREVKALAKLDHIGIVRYHQSWFESPPPGWQEARDKACIEMPSSTPGYSAGSCTTSAFVQHDNKQNNNNDSSSKEICRLSQLYLGSSDRFTPLNKLDDHNPLKPFLDEVLCSAGQKPVGFHMEANLQAEDSDPKAGSSGGFEPCLSTLEGSGDCVVGDESFCSWDSAPCEQLNSDLFSLALCSDSGTGTGSPRSMEDIDPEEVPFHTFNSDSTILDFRDQSDSLDIVFAESTDYTGQSADHTRGHQAVNNANSQSNGDIGQSSQRVDQLGTSCNQRMNSSGLSLTQASRPKDLPLDLTKSQQDENTSDKLYLYIQMQLCKRENLKDWLAANTHDRGRPLVLDIFHQIVSAIDYVHDKGLVHRDLKPSNIFFSMDGIVKIGDFGLVTALEETAPTPYDDRVTTKRRLTSQVGTRLYMSPEQHAGGHYTNKVDIYALGLIFFELLYPFGTQMERIQTLTDVKCLRFPEKFINMLSKDEVAFFHSLLSRDPDQRPSCKVILSQPMLEPFEKIHKAYIQARARTSSRIHTCSTSSNHSGSGSGSA